MFGAPIAWWRERLTRLNALVLSPSFRQPSINARASKQTKACEEKEEERGYSCPNSP